jgi:hypothetical protein
VRAHRDVAAMALHHHSLNTMSYWATIASPCSVARTRSWGLRKKWLVQWPKHAQSTTGSCAGWQAACLQPLDCRSAPWRTTPTAPCRVCMALPRQAGQWRSEGTALTQDFACRARPPPATGTVLDYSTE